MGLFEYISQTMKFNRRRMLKLTLVGGFATFGYAWQIEPRWVAIQHLDMPIPDLTDSLVGKTCVQLSDLHIGLGVGESYLRRQFEYVKTLNPDFVFYTGDFVDFADNHHFKLLRKIMPDAPQGSIGTAGVLGNHDFAKHLDGTRITKRIEGFLNEVGINILRDSAIELGELRVAGLEDFWSSKFRPKSARDGIRSGERPSIVLSHNPDTADLDVWGDFNGWILCGHTHGGQCVIPFVGPPIIPVQNRDYVSGVYDLGSQRKMYINRGLGHTLKARFCARPEITVFRLTKA